MGSASWLPNSRELTGLEITGSMPTIMFNLFFLKDASEVRLHNWVYEIIKPHLNYAFFVNTISKELLLDVQVAPLTSSTNYIYLLSFHMILYFSVPILWC